MRASEKVLNFALDVIFPKRCLICGAYDTWFCEDCQNSAILQNDQICIICNRPSLNGVVHPTCATRSTLDGLMAAGKFDQLQELIHSFKYNLIKDLAPALAEIYVKFIQENNLEDFFEQFCLLPVPLHKSRLRFRGFNQSHLIAEELAKRLKIPLLAEALVRIKNTEPQTTLDKSRRETNMEESFACPDSEIVRNKKILLIDDIATTGATLNECAKALKSAHAQTVWALVLGQA